MKRLTQICCAAAAVLTTTPVILFGVLNWAGLWMLALSGLLSLGAVVLEFEGRES
jgi:hypothetical protein